MTPVALGLQALLAAMELYNTLRARALQTGELTAEEDAENTRMANEMMAQSHWQIDPDVPPPSDE